jgi:hypothetical protein
MAKFFFFEKIVQLFYTHVFTQPKETYGQTTQLGITFTSGYLAGVVCAIVSHPADSLVSQLGKVENKGKSIGTISKEVGIVSLATKGLGTRVIMIGQCPASSGTETGELNYLQVLSRASNGGSMTPSSPLWVWVPPVVNNRRFYPIRQDIRLTIPIRVYYPFPIPLHFH